MHRNTHAVLGHRGRADHGARGHLRRVSGVRGYCLGGGWRRCALRLLRNGVSGGGIEDDVPVRRGFRIGRAVGRVQSRVAAVAHDGHGLRAGEFIASGAYAQVENLRNDDFEIHVRHGARGGAHLARFDLGFGHGRERQQQRGAGDQAVECTMPFHDEFPSAGPSVHSEDIDPRQGYFNDYLWDRGNGQRLG